MGTKREMEVGMETVLSQLSSSVPSQASYGLQCCLQTLPGFTFRFQYKLLVLHLAGKNITGQMCGHKMIAKGECVFSNYPLWRNMWILMYLSKCHYLFSRQNILKKHSIVSKLAFWKSFSFNFILIFYIMWIGSWNFFGTAYSLHMYLRLLANADGQWQHLITTCQFWVSKCAKEWVRELGCVFVYKWEREAV